MCIRDSPFPYIYLERREPSCNMARFYALSMESDLFGDTVAIRRWGRIGTHGQSLRIAYADAALARTDLLAMLAAKRHRGYRPVND